MRRSSGDPSSLNHNSIGQASIAVSGQSHSELFTQMSKRMRSCHLHQMNTTGKFNIKENKMGTKFKSWIVSAVGSMGKHWPQRIEQGGNVERMIGKD